MYRCDGHSDCDDKSDETSCRKYKTYLCYILCIYFSCYLNLLPVFDVCKAIGHIMYKDP